MFELNKVKKMQVSLVSWNTWKKVVLEFQNFFLEKEENSYVTCMFYCYENIFLNGSFLFLVEIKLYMDWVRP